MAIKIENIVPPSAEQWMEVIHGCRNPYESWAKSDSGIQVDEEIYIGDSDLALMRKLAKAGSDHRKFLRQLPVIMDVTAPFYFWKEADQYKVGTVTNSCSTMHTLHKRDLTADDFSCEYCPGFIGGVIETINGWRKRYIETNDKKYWYAMIQLLPESFNQTRTLSCNYEVLWNMYCARKSHKLNEWVQFCETIVREVPYFAEIFEIENDGTVYSEEIVRGRTIVRFSSLFRRGTEYAIEHIYAYHKYALLSHLRYDVFRDGEFIGQEAEYECALRLVAVDFAYRLWRGPLGVILRDEDRLEELVWWFVREIPEKRENVSIVTNAYRPTETPEGKPDPPRLGSSVEKPRNPVTDGDIEDEIVKTIAGLYKAGITEDEADGLIRKLSALSGMRATLNEVSTASVVTQKRIT